MREADPSPAPALPSVSVVIPHYGEGADTAGLIRLLREQDYSGEVQVVVVDDFSPRPLAAVDGARVIRRDSNGGFGTAVNTGARVADGELLLVLNSDVLPTGTFIRELVDAAMPWMPAVVSPWLVDPSGHPDYAGHRFPTVLSRAVEQLHSLYRIKDSQVFNSLIRRRGEAGEATVVDWLTGAALLMPRAVFEEVGGFDESFFMNCEETDLQRRLGSAGVRSVLLGEVRLVHDAGRSSDPAQRRRWLRDAQLRYAEKWSSPTALRLAWTATALANAGWHGVRSLTGRRAPVVQQLRDDLALAWGDPADVDSREMRAHAGSRTAARSSA